MEKSTSYAMREEMANFKKTLRQWVDQQQSAIGNAHKAHAAAVKQGKAVIDQHKQNQEEWKAVIANNEKRAMEASRKVDELQREIDELEQCKEVVPAEIERVKQQQEEQQLLAEKYQAEIEELTSKRRYEVNELSKGVMFFRQRLGLEFEANDGLLKLQFKYIDPKDPQKLFYFTIFVDEHTQYHLRECRPALDSDTLENMVNTLNKTNDFAWFVQSMRRMFKTYAVSSAARAPRTPAPMTRPQLRDANATIPANTANKTPSKGNMDWIASAVPRSVIKARGTRTPSADRTRSGDSGAPAVAVYPRTAPRPSRPASISMRSFMSPR